MASELQPAPADFQERADQIADDIEQLARHCTATGTLPTDQAVGALIERIEALRHHDA